MPAAATPSGTPTANGTRCSRMTNGCTTTANTTRMLNAGGGRLEANGGGNPVSGTVVAYIPDVHDPLAGGAWQCHCRAVWSPTPLIYWQMGGEYHSASICWDHGEALLPDGAAN